MSADMSGSKARLERPRQLARRAKAGALVAALAAFVSAVPLVRATHRSHPRRTHPLQPPSDFLAVVSVDNFGAGDLAPGQAPPVVSSGGS
jgi:hypothetical protein